MKFKDFINLAEAGPMGGTDNGLMGVPKQSSVRKPSDGQPFKNLGPVAGQEPRGNSGGMNAKPAMFMKKMKKC